MATDSTQTDNQRITELLRVNAELAAEIRDLKLGRRASPRISQVPAARGLAKLEAERRSLGAELDSSQAQAAALERERDDLLRHRDELDREVRRLREGVRGALRRIRARLLRA